MQLAIYCRSYKATGMQRVIVAQALPLGWPNALWATTLHERQRSSSERLARSGGSPICSGSSWTRNSSAFVYSTHAYFQNSILKPSVGVRTHCNCRIIVTIDSNYFEAKLYTRGKQFGRHIEANIAGNIWGNIGKNIGRENVGRNTGAN